MAWRKKSGTTGVPTWVELDDGTEFFVMAGGRDMARYETYAAKHNLPAASDGAPLTATRFVAWAAAVRQGKIPPTMTWDQFDRQAEVTDAEDPEGDGEPADMVPTGPAHRAG